MRDFNVLYNDGEYESVVGIRANEVSAEYINNELTICADDVIVRVHGDSNCGFAIVEVK